MKINFKKCDVQLTWRIVKGKPASVSSKRNLSMRCPVPTRIPVKVVSSYFCLNTSHFSAVHRGEGFEGNSF
jgi:hypothetical protein